MLLKKTSLEVEKARNKRSAQQKVQRIFDSMFSSAENWFLFFVLQAQQSESALLLCFTAENADIKPDMAKILGVF